jgi:hypothetical protein
MPQEEDAWNHEGVLVTHSTFGTGEVVQVGPYHGVETVWIAFDRGMIKFFDVRYARPHLRLRSADEPRTPADPAEVCDVCGARPVALTVQGDQGVQRFCADHRSSYRP